MKRKGYGAVKWFINSSKYVVSQTDTYIYFPRLLFFRFLLYLSFALCRAGILANILPFSVAEIKSMKSYINHQFFRDVGEELPLTQNCFSWIGCCSMTNASHDALEADYERYE